MKDAIEIDSEKEVEAEPSTESMDVEIVGVTAVENDDKSDSVKLDEELSEKDRDKKPDSEESGTYVRMVVFSERLQFYVQFNSSLPAIG